MRTVLMVVFCLLAALVACGTDRDALQAGDMGVVVSATRDRKTGVAKAELSVAGTARWLVVERVTDAPYQTGLAARLLDRTGVELVRVEFAWPEDGRDALWFKEAAGANVLVSHRVTADDRVTESYVVDGDEFHVDYPVLEERAMNRAAQAHRNGERPEVADVGVTEYVDALASFERFVGRHRGNGLHANPDGELLMDLLSDRSIMDAILGVERPNPELPNERANRACLIAGTCAGLKCMLGGLLNFICTACGGMSAACTIADFACWLAVDCN